ncbi:MAG TPA: helix-turn-helix domain-containing protein [Candidatus Saccharimonadales bacterium]|nr:helix-turn-helix domain-containing protein [Candidatus Saccharimonadales bacterium]
MVTAQLFNALGDPTRLEIIQRLSTGPSFTITAISEGIAMSRQGIRKHLQILAEARLIKFLPRGRDTHIELDARTLEQAKAFITQLERQWDKRLESLRDFVESDS